MNVKDYIVEKLGVPSLSEIYNSGFVKKRCMPRRDFLAVVTVCCTLKSVKVVVEVVAWTLVA